MKQLTQADLSAISSRLDAMKRQVLDELREGNAGLHAEAATAGHDVHAHADDAEAGREEDLRIAELQIDRNRLEDIEQAELRLSCGRYGICAECGEVIARERLLAQPTAIRCTGCQAAREAPRRM